MMTRLALVLCLAGGLAAIAQQPQAAAPQSTKPLEVRNTAVPQKLEFLNRGGWSAPWERYQPANVAPPDLANPAALRQGVQSGTLYLSMRQMLELTLTADLDIADASYAKLQAGPDYLRTLAGGSARGVAGETISSALFNGAIGAGGAGSSGAFGSGAGSALGGSAGVHGGGGGYDPSVNISFADEHTRQPLNSSAIFGTSIEQLNQAQGGISFGQSFTTGTGYSVSFASGRSYQNSSALFVNPEVVSDMSFGISQNLLSGGSRSANRANIEIGKNSLVQANANFKLQVTDAVAQAATQYWTLAGAGQLLDIARQAEQQAQQTLDDTNDLIQQGKVPAANRITAQTGLFGAEQAVTQAHADYAKAASKLKVFLAKQWSPNLIQTRVVTTEVLPQPEAANLPAVQDLVATAVNFSPKLAEDRVTISNDDLTVKVRKDSLLPGLGVFASYTSSGVGGVELNCSVAALPCPVGSTLPPIISGFGQSFSRIFSYRAPDYGFGVQLSIPVWNRSNRADEATAELQAAQAHVDLQKDQNVVSEQVNEDRIELESQVGQLKLARQSADEFNQALSDARTKYQLGKGTVTDVLAAESALTGAQKAVVAAQQAYAIARVALAKDSGTLLDKYHISLGKPATPATVGRLK
ncbi:MAG: TolC family protein [Terriglobales bacterium]